MKKIQSDYLLSLANLLLQILAPMITLPYITRIFAPESMGDLAYVASVSKWFATFASIGLGVYAVRTLSATAPEDRPKVFHELFQLNVWTTLIAGFFYTVIVFPLAKTNLDLYLLQYVVLIALVVEFSWYFTSVQNFRIGLVRNVVIKIITIVAIFVWVNDPSDLFLYAALQIGIQLFCSLFLIPETPLMQKWVLAKFEVLKHHLSRSLPFFMTALAIQIYTVVDRLLLGNLSNHHELGLYDLAFKLVLFSTAFFSAAGNVLLPKFSEILAMGDKSAWSSMIHRSLGLTSIMGLILALVWMSVDRSLIGFVFGSKYLELQPVLFVMAPVLVFLAWSNVFSLQTLIPHAMEKHVNQSVWGAAFVNLVMNFLLIPKYGALGSALAWCLSEFTASSLQFWYAHRFYRRRLALQVVLGSLLGVLMMAFLSFGETPLIERIVYAVLILGLYSFFVWKRCWLNPSSQGV